MPKRTDLHTILLIGSGPIVIGQGAEFDYSGTQALKALTLNPDDAERLGQREDLERKLKLLTPGGKGR